MPRLIRSAASCNFGGEKEDGEENDKLGPVSRQDKERVMDLTKIDMLGNVESGSNK